MELFPGEQSAELRCQLVDCPVRNAPAYRALSYVWGDLEMSRQIKCDDLLLPIRENLYAALLELRSKTNIVLLWVDAISIDQSNIQERSHQVKMMAQIFKLAELVYLWLGVFPDDTNLAMNKKAWANDVPQLNAFTYHEHKTWNHIVSKEWFRRTWIVQECCLAREIIVLYGHHSISWAWLVSFARHRPVRRDPRIYSRFDSPQEHLRPIIELNRLRGKVQGGARLPLLELLQLTRDRESSDPKDKVYAGLGMLKPAVVKSLSQVDYSLSVEDLYARTARDCILGSSSLRVLTDVYHTSKSLMSSKLRSWAPDWRTARPPIYGKSNKGPSLATPAGHIGRKIGGEKIDALFLEDCHVLSLKALILGTLHLIKGLKALNYEKFLKSKSKEAKSLRLAQSCGYSFTYSRTASSIYIPPASQRKVAWDTPGSCCWAKAPDRKDHFGPMYVHIDLPIIGAGRGSSHGKEDTTSVLKVQLRSHDPAEPEDLVCVFPAQKDTAFVIRPVGDAFKLVGACHMPWPEEHWRELTKRGAEMQRLRLI